MNLNGALVTRVGNTIFIPLPRELWRSSGHCSCGVCRGLEGFWDTLAVAKNPDPRVTDYAWTVHYPQLHPLEYRAIRETFEESVRLNKTLQEQMPWNR